MSTDEVVKLEDMDELFRAKISEFLYARAVVEKLNTVKEKFLLEQTMLDQAKIFSANLCQILQDSGQVNEVLVLINKYLETGNIATLLAQTQRLARKVELQEVNIDDKKQKEIQDTLNKNGETEIPKVPKTEIEISIKKGGKKTSMYINMQSIARSIWQQEMSRISHDFNNIDKKAAPYMVDVACNCGKERLQEFCDFLKDVLALRKQYEPKKIGFFTKSISPKKTKILNNIEKKLAELVNAKKTINWRELYKELRPVLEAEAANIEKSGDLKSMINDLISKYNHLTLPSSLRPR